MKYRTMRFIGGEENVSLLGLGCMRFPLNEDGTIDEAQAEAMIGRALNAGINYIDTAYPYHKGESVEIPWSMFLSALLLAIFAEIYAQAIKLKEEQDLTI